MNKPIKISGDRTLYVDCDDTLVMWDLSKYPTLPRITVDLYGPTELVVNEPNVRTAMKFAKMGYTVIIWSLTGADWAECVARATGLDAVAAAYMTKPSWYLDDKPSKEWCSRKLWRDADHTGDSK